MKHIIKKKKKQYYMRVIPKSCKEKTKQTSYKTYTKRQE